MHFINFVLLKFIETDIKITNNNKIHHQEKKTYACETEKLNTMQMLAVTLQDQKVLSPTTLNVIYS